MRKRLLASVGIASLLVLGLPTSALAASETVVDTPAEPIMVDNSEALIPLNVAATGPVAKVIVAVEFLSNTDGTCMQSQDVGYNFPNELEIVLTSPIGTQATLVSSRPPSFTGTSPSMPVEITFDDAATAGLRGVPVSGTFKPFSPLSVFNGEQAAGAWELRFADTVLGQAKCYFGASLTVEAGATSTTTLVASPDSVALGAPVTLTATVAGEPETDPGTDPEPEPTRAARSALPPTGIVTFMEGAATLGTATLDANGEATFPTSFATVGEHLVTAVYPGDDNYDSSDSQPQAIYAYALPATTTTLAASNTAPNTGQAVTFTATIVPTPHETETFAPAAAGPGVTGTVQFLNGATLLGEAPVVDGVAAATFSFLTAGDQPVTAMYSGDKAFAGSTSEVTLVKVATPPVAPAANTPAKPLANTGSSAPPAGVILWGLGLAAAGLLTAVGARAARRSQAK